MSSTNVVFPYVKVVGIKGLDEKTEKMMERLPSMLPNAILVDIQYCSTYFEEKEGKSVDDETTSEKRIINFFTTISKMKNVKTLRLCHSFDPPEGSFKIISKKITKLEIREPTYGICHMITGLRGLVSLESLTIDMNEFEDKLFCYKELLDSVCKNLKELWIINYDSFRDKRIPLFGEVGFIKKIILKDNPNLKVGFCWCNELCSINDIVSISEGSGFRKKTIFVCKKCEKCEKCSRKICVGDWEENPRCLFCRNKKLYCRGCMKKSEMDDGICPKCDLIKGKCGGCGKMCSRLGMGICGGCNKVLCDRCKNQCPSIFGMGEGCAGDCDDFYCGNCIVDCCGFNDKEGCAYGCRVCIKCSQEEFFYSNEMETIERTGLCWECKDLCYSFG